MDRLQNRRNLKKILHEILTQSGESGGVYFQPPSGYRLTYPCIIFNLDRLNSRKADNRAYSVKDSYNVTVISRDPNNTIAWDILENITASRFDRRVVTDGLYHDHISIKF